MQITEQQLASALRRCREKRSQDMSQTGIAMGLHPDSYRRREKGDYSLKVVELIRLASHWGISPVGLLWEVLNESDKVMWEEAASKLGCTPAIARDRLQKEAHTRQMTVWQVWLMVEKDQIRVR